LLNISVETNSFFQDLMNRKFILTGFIWAFLLQCKRLYCHLW